MQPEFWRDRWRTGQIGFHQSAVDRYLREYWPALRITGRVLVPLCGKSLDLLWLLTQGHEVAGVELSAVALESFCMENGVPARRRTIQNFDVYEAANLALYGGDFFALARDELGPVTAVYDRAALISWSPELRAPYVQHLSALTDGGTQTLLITMEFARSQIVGPPFSVSADDVERLYGQDHEIQLLERQDVLAHEPRLQARGLTELHEVCYRLTRRDRLS